MHEGFRFPINVAEDNTAQQEKFINRFPQASPVINEALDTSLSAEQFAGIIERFNQDQPELIGPYSKDYLTLENGRQINLYWDEQKNVRLGYSLEPESYAPEEN